MGQASQSPLSRLIAPAKARLYIACVLQALSAVAGIVPFIAVAELGRALLVDSAVDHGRIWWIGGVAVLAMALRLVFLMAAAAMTHLADLDLQLHLRRQMAAHLSKVPLGWFGERSAGDVKKALQDDITALHHIVGHSYTNMVSAIVTPLIALGYLLWADWRLTLAAILPMLIGMALYAIQFRGYGEKMADYNRALADVNAASVEFVQGIAVIKTFGQSQKAYGRFIERTHAFIDYFWNWVRGLITISAMAEVVLSPLFSLALVLAAGLLLVGAGLTEPLDVLPFVVFAPGLTAPFMTLAILQNESALAKEAARRIIGLLDTPTLTEPRADTSPKGARVAFEDVYFSYDGETEVLKAIDLVLEPGTVTALVGPSGSGKSTLARLLPRFYDVSAGRITIGGADVTEMNPETLYRSTGFVFQHVQLLRASIAQNIGLGKPAASGDEIERAARAAQIHERILEFPNGYQSIIGEDAQLSGGEAQRVSIARALLADTPVLILDEATAFADPESEAAIQEALSTLIKGRTLLVIAHRLYSITGADQICVMEDGQIAERGQHQDLLDRKGLYYRLWQASETAIGTMKEPRP